MLKEENGAGKNYGQTSWKEQLEDIEWAFKEGRRVEGCGNIPVFLMGYSMVRSSLFSCLLLLCFLNER
jgi:acylglycerol lipase